MTVPQSEVKTAGTNIEALGGGAEHADAGGSLVDSCLHGHDVPGRVDHLQDAQLPARTARSSSLHHTACLPEVIWWQH